MSQASSSTIPRVLSDADYREKVRRSSDLRKTKNRVFRGFCLGVASLSLLVLAVLLGAILWQGIAYIDWQFLSAPPNPDATLAGIWPALGGTIWVCVICALAALPLGVATAIFLEEFQPRKNWVRRIHGFVQLNISNLAGVPSVVYGIIGFTVFASMFGLFGSPGNPSFQFGLTPSYQIFNMAGRSITIPAEGRSEPNFEITQDMQGMAVTTSEGESAELNVIGFDEEFPSYEENPELAARTATLGTFAGRTETPSWYYFRLPFGSGALTGGLTLMLVILPIVIIASQESLRAVPNSLRDGALGMGCTQWQVVRRVTLPAAIPGIMTGSIIAMSRAIGETAPLLMIAGVVFVAAPPSNLMGQFTALPLQIFNWAGRPQEEFHQIAAAGIIVLLAVLLMFNAVAVLIRQKLQKPLS